MTHRDGEDNGGMTARVIITDAADLIDVLDRLDAVAAPLGWRVRRPADAAAMQSRAREAHVQLRLPAPLVVEFEPDPDAARAAAPIDAGALLSRSPVPGAVADGSRRLHRG